MAFKEGCLQGKPVLLEPVMKVEVVSPEEYLGTVNGDLNRRRGVLQGTEDSPAGRIIRAEVPLSEMFGYATDLRSATQGRATYTMEFCKYVEAPASVAEAVIKQKK
jgi:elongation factor G